MATKKRAAARPVKRPAVRGRKTTSRQPTTSTPGVTPSGDAFPIVGIGASAGGLEAFTQLLSRLPEDPGVAIVLVQHLDRERESALVPILSRATRLAVFEARTGTRVERDRVYVLPPNAVLRIANGVLRLSRRPRARGPQRAVDAFLESLAEQHGSRAIGVVLSGTGSDGTRGLEAIKVAGGITIAQDDTAKYDSMPRSAIAVGCVDLVLPPDRIAAEIVRIARHLDGGGQRPAKAPRQAAGRATGTATPRAAATDDGIQRDDRKVLMLLRGHTGVDFSHYKPATIRRRIARRMIITRHETIADYERFLRGNGEELSALYSDLLISVTSFFRNPETFEALQRDVLPGLLRERGDEPVRVWVLGCSTGQEAYSIAMAFVEAAERARRTRPLQIFATDLNEALLDKARQGFYAKSLVEDLSPERLGRFFVEEEGGYRIAKPIREMIVFARQNLATDPPFSRLDIVSCRNVLIYLEPALQQKVIPTFHFALKPGGYLLLGASESVGPFTDLFEPFDRKHKIYVRKGALTTAQHVRLARGTETGSGARRRSPERAGQAAPESAAAGEANATREADRITVNQFAPPAVLLDSNLQVLQFRGTLSPYLEPATGKASFDVLKMAREGLLLPLRAALNQARREHRTVRRDNVRVHQDGSERAVTIHVVPLRNVRERSYLVLFQDAKSARGAPAAPPPKPDARHEKSRVRALEAELADQREYLQATQEQNEATNEELQAAHEEVQSANEELQSINEELETSKEELESANEELTTVNEEMSTRNAELARLNNDLVNLQTSVRLAIVWVGRDLRVRGFSSQAEKQFDLQASDIGQPVARIRHPLTIQDPEGTASADVDLAALAQDVITTVREREIEVKSGEDRWFSLRLRPYLTHDNKVDGVVLMLVDIDLLKGSELVLAAARDYAENALAAVRDPLVVLDEDLRVLSASAAYYRTFRVEPQATIGRAFRELGNGQWDVPTLTEALVDALEQKGGVRELAIEHDFEAIGRRTMLINAQRIVDPQRQTRRLLVIINDATERRRAEAASAYLAAIVASSQDAIIAKDLAGNVTTWNAAAERLFGYQAAEIVGKPGRRLVPENRRDEHEAILDRVRRGESIARYETARVHRSGVELDVSLTVSAVRDSAGVLVGTAEIVRDVSERSRLMQHAQVQAESLAELHRKKDEFLAMLSHGLRNPLAAIATAAQLLRPPRRAKQVDQAHGIIDRQVGQLTRLVDDLLEVSRITTGRIHLERARVVLQDVVERAVETIAPLVALRGHELNVALARAPIVVDGDALRIEQVVVNLLTNAAKYTDDGGRIELSLAREAGDAVLRVRDTGVGIAPEILPRVFGLFEQADRSLERSQGGLGIGLSLVQRIVELHGGRVDATSTLGEGSEFVVRLPVAPQIPAKAAGPSRSAPAIANPLRVLVVDDMLDAAQALAMLLETAGHEVRVVHDGAEVRDAALDFRPDVVLLDIGLPGLDGYEVARQLRREPLLDKLVLVALTGYGRDADQRRTRAAGFDYHIVKPASLDVLQGVLAGVRQRSG